MIVDSVAYCDQCKGSIRRGKGKLTGGQLLCPECLKVIKEATDIPVVPAVKKVKWYQFDPGAPDKEHPCPTCGKMKADNAMWCLHCGALNSKKFGWMVLIVFIVIVLGMILDAFGSLGD
jgi:hypothetical protein